MFDDDNDYAYRKGFEEGKKSTFEELEKKVIEWAEDRMIFIQSNPSKQVRKLGEEYLELFASVYDRDPIGEKDGIGDMIVVLIILANMYDMSIFDCLNYAYSEIKNRKGKMVNGIFVKEL